MIVSLEQVKALLGIDLTDDSEDEHLTQLILAATVFVEGETHWRFDTPAEKVEYQVLPGFRAMYLRGHVDMSTPPESESAFNSTVRIAVRAVGDVGAAWEDLVEGVDYERRDDTIIFAGPYGPGWYGWAWPGGGAEFRATYMDGYWEAPEDIQQLLLEIVTRQYTTDIDLASGVAGVTSEHIGDYSYTIDLGAAASITGGTIPSTGWMTINRYKRLLV